MNNQLTDEESKAGWHLLFDGNTTDGWHLYNRGKVPSAWVFIDVMEDSAIRTAWASGPEYQLLDGLHPDNTSPTKRSGCFFGLFPQLNHVDPKPAGEWNQSR